jgi:hypothetical protein
VAELPVRERRGVERGTSRRLLDPPASLNAYHRMW